MNELVSKEIAILLKKVGFDGECNFYYEISSDKVEELQYYHTDRNYSNYMGFPDKLEYFIPTISTVIDWLYSKGIWVNVEYFDDNLKFCVTVTLIENNYLLVEQWKFDTPYLAYIEGIKQHLINETTNNNFN